MIYTARMVAKARRADHWLPDQAAGQRKELEMLDLYRSVVLLVGLPQRTLTFYPVFREGLQGHVLEQCTAIARVVFRINSTAQLMSTDSKCFLGSCGQETAGCCAAVSCRTPSCCLQDSSPAVQPICWFSY